MDRMQFSGAKRKTTDRVLPNCITKAKSERRRQFIADQLDDCKDMSGLFYLLPFQKGYLVNWEVEKQIWDYMFGKDVFNCQFEETCLILTEPYFNFTSIRESLVEVLYEEYQFHSLLLTTGPETAEAGPDCASAVHEDEDAWEHLRSVDEVPTGISFSDYVNADANAVTTEVLTDADMLRLVGSVEGVTAEDAADDPAGAEAPVPTPGQVMDALDLLRHFAGAHEGTEDALDALQT
ncbi:hypothetical protein V5799_027727 [Amblyomma americanum]|uniref:Uncharacterized protein n=1 Tax=Amblyomma americanum TaxID=6943 RepID=A0AAQ4DEW8_AMBAM